MNGSLYIPNLKTSDSELRALRHLSSDVKSKILPAFELTRSRATTKNPKGSVFRRAEQLLEAYGSSSMVLDITTENDLLNEEMEGFFDETGGYAKWRNFLEAVFTSNMIPCVQYVEGGSEREFKRQVSALVQKYGKIVIRTSVADLEADSLFKWALEVTEASNIGVISMLYFMEQGAENVYLDRCARFLRTVIGNRVPESIAFPGSSFPKAVGSGDYGNDHEGTFPASELTLFGNLKSTYPNMPLVYSDYASVHPIRYPTRGGSWVPRIDISRQGQFIFSRLRNNSGGYAAAAREIFSNYSSDLTPSWGADQIKQAAGGTPPGRSPSFWISVRINMWITQRVLEIDK